MPRIKIRQSEQEDHDGTVIIETGSEQKFSTGSSNKRILESRTYYEDPSAEE